MTTRRRLTLLTLGLALSAVAGARGEVKFFQMQTQRAFLAGTLDGIAVDPLGTLELADRVERLSDLDEPFVFSAAAHPDGWVVGTGNAGRVLLIGRQGEIDELFAAPEGEIFAVWADPDGTVFAGSSPDGKVYRIAGGVGEPFFDPGEKYVWDLARAADGSLLVATGTRGKLFRVDDDGEGETLFDSEDTHVRALEVLPGGDVLAGTAGEGLILRIAPDGKARTLYDAAQPEVVDFAVGDDGGAWAAVLASEASLVDLTQRPQQAAGEQAEAGQGQGGGDGAQVTVGAGLAAGSFAGSRPGSYQGPRAEILALSPEGRAETVWQFDDETVYALGWFSGRLWAGTGLEGKLYSLRDRKMVLEKDVDERQVVALLADTPGPAFATANASAFYRVSGSRERRGVFTSPALDAGQIARFGTLRWRGEAPRGTGLEFAFRSGISAEPDRTWSAWTGWQKGDEVAADAVPPGRYLQWRARLSAADGRSPLLRNVAVSYLQLNLPPRIEGLEVKEPGEILVPANFNPANQAFEPVSPNRDGIFTTLEPVRSDSPRKTLWKRGYRTLSWEVDDPNGDDLVYDLAFRPEGWEGDWLEMASELEEDFYSFDATALPDGVYRFRLLAADRAVGGAEAALTAEEVSEPVLIDHTPPLLGEVSRRGDELFVEVTDGANPMRQAEVSVDARSWSAAPTADGLLDGRSETLRLAAPAGSQLLLLRVVDAAFNVVTFDLSRYVR